MWQKSYVVIERDPYYEADQPYVMIETFDSFSKAMAFVKNRAAILEQQDKPVIDMVVQIRNNIVFWHWWSSKLSSDAQPGLTIIEVLAEKYQNKSYIVIRRDPDCQYYVNELNEPIIDLQTFPTFSQAVRFIDSRYDNPNDDSKIHSVVTEKDLVKLSPDNPVIWHYWHHDDIYPEMTIIEVVH